MLYITDFAGGKPTYYGPFVSVEFLALQTTTPAVDPVAVIYNAYLDDDTCQRVTVSTVHSIVTRSRSEEETT